LSGSASAWCGGGAGRRFSEKYGWHSGGEVGGGAPKMRPKVRNESDERANAGNSAAYQKFYKKEPEVELDAGIHTGESHEVE
jgi:hypothetical protein